MAHTGLLAIQAQSRKHRRQSSAGIDHSRGLCLRMVENLLCILKGRTGYAGLAQSLDPPIAPAC